MGHHHNSRGPGQSSDTQTSDRCRVSYLNHQNHRRSRSPSSSATLHIMQTSRFELSKQLRVGKLHARIAALEIRVHKLENAKMTLRSTEADLLRRLAWYCPEKWAHLAARTARALPPEWRWPRDRGAVAGLAIHTCAVAVQTGT